MELFLSPFLDAQQIWVETIFASHHVGLWYQEKCIHTERDAEPVSEYGTVKIVLKFVFMVLAHICLHILMYQGPPAKNGMWKRTTDKQTFIPFPTSNGKFDMKTNEVECGIGLLLRSWVAEPERSTDAQTTVKTEK